MTMMMMITVAAEGGRGEGDRGGALVLEGKLCLNGFQHWLWHEIQFNLSAQAKTTPEEEQRESAPQRERKLDHFPFQR